MKTSNLFRIFILSFMFVAFTSSVKGQALDTIYVTLSQPASILGCSDNVFTVTMTVDSITDLSIFIQVMGLDNNPADTTCIGLSSVLVEIDTPDPHMSNIAYNPLTSTWSCLIDPGGSPAVINFTYKVIVDCSVIQGGSGVYSTNNTYLLQEWIASNDDFFNLNLTTLNTIVSPNIFSPYLNDISNLTYSSSYGNTVDLLFEYKNNGVDADILFWFDPDGLGNNCNSYVQVDSLEFAIRDPLIGIGSYSIYTPLSWRSITLPSLHSVVIRRRVEVIDCLNPCNDEHALFRWRCDVPTADTIFCVECQETFQTKYSITQDANQSILVERISPSQAITNFDYSCPGDTIRWTYRITNTGNGTAPLVNMFMAYLLDTLRMLTQIDTATIRITPGCTGCLIDTTFFLRTDPPICSTLNQLWRMIMTIRELAPGDSVDISFITEKCCSEDSTLMNVGKTFNHWWMRFDSMDSCGVSIPVTKDYPSGNQGYIAGISVGVNNADLDLQLQFIPTVTDLTVPSDTTGPPSFGPSVTMDVGFQGLFPSIWDYQLVGCDTNPNCLMQGYLRATIYTMQGLHLRDFAGVHFEHPMLDDWNHEFFYTDKADTSQCIEGRYYFYFNLSDSVARTMLNEGTFFYTLQACCGIGDVPVSEYSADFHLLMDPDNCITIAANTSLTSAPTCFDCCWLPLSSEGDEIQVHCPGCLHPGIIVDRYELERLNFGLQDDDNDGRADNPLAIIEKDSAYYNDHTLIRPKFSMHGDLLQDVTVSHFQHGESYTYPQMITSPNDARLTFLQLNRRIGEASDISMDVTVQDFDFYIDVRDTTGGCIDCDVQHIADTMFRTIHYIHVSNDSLPSYLQAVNDSAARVYLYTFGADTVYNMNIFWNRVFPHPDSSAQFDGFEEGQRYRLVTRYSVCGNWESGISGDHWKQSAISNLMYLTGLAMDWDAPIVAPPNDTSGFSFPVDSLFADTSMFFCETFGGLHFFVSNDMFHSSVFLSQGCNNTLLVRPVTRIGADPFSDLFPFEFRLPAFKPVNYRVELPVGMSMTGVSLHSASQQGIFGFNSTPQVFSISPPDMFNHYHFGDTSYTALSCFHESVTIPIDTTLYAFDQRLRLLFTFDVEMDSCIEGLSIANDSIIFVEFEENRDSSSCIQYMDTLCTPIVVEKIAPAGNSVSQPDPTLTLVITNVTVPATQNQVCWTFNFSNPATAVPNDQSAYNVYLIPPDNSAIPYLTNWTVTPTGQAPLVPDVNGVIHVADTLTTNSTLSVQVCANFTYCELEVDSIPVIWGWNCDDYPVPGDGNIPCNETITNIIFDPEDAAISTPSKFAPLSVELCDTLYFGTILTPSNAAYIFPDSVHLFNVPPFFTIIEAYLGNDSLGVVLDSIALPIGVLEWEITETMLNDIGFTTFGFPAPYGLKVSYYALIGCTMEDEFFLPDHYLVYHSYCYDTLDHTVHHSDPINIIPTQCTSCFTISKTALQDTIFTGDTTTFQVVVCANNIDADTVAFIDLLPANFTPITLIPDTLFLPAIGCDTLLVEGVFALSGSCTDPGMWNIATILFADTSLSSQACVEVLPGCIALADSIIADSSFSSTYGSGFSGITVYIDGRFYIDNNFYVQNCTILVAAGGQIIIQPGFSLVLDSSVVEGCDFMWQGIVVEEEAILGVIDSSTVRDADIAVYAKNTSMIYLTDSYFENNNRSVFVPPSDTTFMNMIDHHIAGNEFLTTDFGFKPTYPGQDSIGVIGYAAIEVHDVLFIVGDTSMTFSNRNHFANLNMGILGHRSMVGVINSRFEVIWPDPNIGVQPTNGYAVSMLGDQDSSVNGHLIVLPDSLGTWTMKSCFGGVYTDYSNAQVFLLEMQEMQTGMTTRNCTDLLQTYVVGCNIQATLFGLDWRMNSGSDRMEAFNNIITVNGDSAVGVLMAEGQIAATAYYRIHANRIEVTDGVAGILGLSVFEPIVEFNSVSIIGTASADFFTGIGLQGCEGSVVSCNEVYGDDDSDSQKLAIANHLSSKSQINCNITDGTGVGFFFGGVSPSAFSGNTMNEHLAGLFLNQSALIDTQDLAGNRWVAASYGSGFGAINMNVVPPTNVFLSLFIYDPGITNHFPVNLPTNNTDWFEPGSGTSFNCSHHTICGEVSLMEGSEELRMRIAEDDTLTAEFIPESKQMARQFLYEELKNDSTLLSSRTEYQNFISAHEAENTGYLYDFKKTFQSGIELSDSVKNELVSLNLLMQEMSDGIFAVDSTFTDIVTGLTFPVRNHFANQFMTYKVQRTSLTQNRNSYSTQFLNDALSKNNLVDAETDPEWNEKIINTISYDYAIGGIENIRNSYSTVLSIAGQCPYKGGKAVYRARTFVSLFNDDIRYDDYNVCLQEGIARSGNSLPLLKKQTISVIPNPANEKVEIILHGKLYGICKVFINDVYGKVVIRDQFNCTDKKHRLNVSQLTPGVYTVYVNANGKDELFEKLVIIR